MWRLLRGVAALIAASALATAAPAQETPVDPLVVGFEHPPQSARPLVYWQWVNGNVSEEGIRLDLQWMHRVGIGGAFMFDIGFRTPPVPQYVDHRIGWGTPEWEHAVGVAASEAHRLGLDFGAQSSGGWSVSGGPMVTPDQAMKKLVWSETIVTPADCAVRLPSPPTNNGPFQSVQIGEAFREPTRSGDVAVIGYRLPEREQRARPRPVLSGVADPALLEDGNYARAATLAPQASGEGIITARFASGATPASVTLAVNGAVPQGAIEASRDGVHFESVVALPGPAQQASPARTYSLGERRDTYWRIRFTGLTRPLEVLEARFEEAARIDRFEDKAGYGVLTTYDAVGTLPTAASSVVQSVDVVDLTQRMRTDGTLDWRPRSGRWAVLRFGWSLTGRRVVPAPAESIGFEVDKLDPVAVRQFTGAFYGRYARAAGANPLTLALTDSWEAGQQNWTPSMFAEFARRRGYDLHPWLPVLTGRIVGDVGRSERFLGDYRRTIADMLADNHYGVLADTAHARGASLYAEAAGTDSPTVIDGIQAKGRVDVPMGEYWYYPEDGAPKPNHIADIREAASAAHLYGHPIVAAEALTTMGEEPWAMGPPQLRRIADRFFAEGVNRVVLHTSAHQPFTDRRPGITLRQYGQHFTRNETWAEDAGAWIDYLARTSFLLQQGRPVADIAIYYGEGAPVSPPFDLPGQPERPSGYDYDFINAESLMRAETRDGDIILPSGARYRVLVIAPRVRRMSLPLIAHLRDLVSQGAILIGEKPMGAEGLAASDAQVESIADQTWGQDSRSDAHGRGRVYASQPDALRTEGVAPDVAGANDANLFWTHRRTADADLYFVANQSSVAFDDVVRFRVVGRRVEIWDAVDASRRRAAYDIADGATAVSLHIDPRSAIFVIFRHIATADHVALPPENRSVLATLSGPWRVAFRDNEGTLAMAMLPTLASWTENSNPGIRYYSGRATYSRNIDVESAWLRGGRHIELDLGAVDEIAHVRVNGRDLGVLWNAPYRRDVTAALHAGANRIEIDVTNYWINRIVGDHQSGAAPVTFAPIDPYTAATLLRPSGLLGPVRMISIVGGT